MANELKKFCSEDNVSKQIPILATINQSKECPVKAESDKVIAAVKAMGSMEIKADDPEMIKKAMDGFNQVITSLNEFSKAAVEKWQNAQSAEGQQNTQGQQNAQ